MTHDKKLREEKFHGTPLFPVEYYPVDFNHPRYLMNFHWHREWELIRIKEGSFHLYANARPVSMKEGDVVLLRGKTLHGGEPTDCMYECLLFDPELLFLGSKQLSEYLSLFISEEFPEFVCFEKNSFPDIATVTDSIMSSCRLYKNADGEDKSYNVLKIYGSILTLFGCIAEKPTLLSHTDDSAQDPYRAEQMKAVLSYMENNYSSEISLDDLAKCANLNPNYFCRVFRDFFHRTPMQYLMGFRAEKAALMLTETSFPLISIAFECGFNDYAYFVRVFKKEKGIAPKRYRDLHSKQITQNAQ